MKPLFELSEEAKPQVVVATRRKQCAYYSEEKALELLPILLTILKNESNKFFPASSYSSARTLATVITQGWKYLIDNGPTMQSLLNLPVDWSKIRELRTRCSCTVTDSGVLLVVKKKAPKLEVVEVESGNVDWKERLADFLRAENKEQVFEEKGLILTGEQISTLIHLLEGMTDELETFNVTKNSIYLKKK